MPTTQQARIRPRAHSVSVPAPATAREPAPKPDDTPTPKPKVTEARAIEREPLESGYTASYRAATNGVRRSLVGRLRDLWEEWYPFRLRAEGALVLAVLELALLLGLTAYVRLFGLRLAPEDAPVSQLPAPGQTVERLDTPLPETPAPVEHVIVVTAAPTLALSAVTPTADTQSYLAGVLSPVARNVYSELRDQVGEFQQNERGTGLVITPECLGYLGGECLGPMTFHALGWVAWAAGRGVFDEQGSPAAAYQAVLAVIEQRMISTAWDESTVLDTLRRGCSGGACQFAEWGAAVEYQGEVLSVADRVRDIQPAPEEAQVAVVRYLAGDVVASDCIGGFDSFGSGVFEGCTLQSSSNGQALTFYSQLP